MSIITATRSGSGRASAAADNEAQKLEFCAEQLRLLQRTAELGCAQPRQDVIEMQDVRLQVLGVN